MSTRAIEANLRWRQHPAAGLQTVASRGKDAVQADPRRALPGTFRRWQHTLQTVAAVEERLSSARHACSRRHAGRKNQLD